MFVGLRPFPANQGRGTAVRAGEVRERERCTYFRTRVTKLKVIGERRKTTDGTAAAPKDAIPGETLVTFVTWGKSH